MYRESKLNKNEQKTYVCLCHVKKIRADSINVEYKNCVIVTSGTQQLLSASCPSPDLSTSYRSRNHTEPTALVIAITKSSLRMSCCHSTTGCEYKENTWHARAKRHAQTHVWTSIMHDITQWPTAEHFNTNVLVLGHTAFLLQPNAPRSCGYNLPTMQYDTKIPNSNPAVNAPGWVR